MDIKLSSELVKLAHAMHAIHEAFAKGYELPPLDDETKKSFHDDGDSQMDEAPAAEVADDGDSPVSSDAAVYPSDEQPADDLANATADAPQSEKVTG